MRILWLLLWSNSLFPFFLTVWHRSLGCAGALGHRISIFKIFLFDQVIEVDGFVKLIVSVILWSWWFGYWDSTIALSIRSFAWFTISLIVINDFIQIIGICWLINGLIDKFNLSRPFFSHFQWALILRIFCDHKMLQVSFRHLKSLLYIILDFITRSRKCLISLLQYTFFTLIFLEYFLQFQILWNFQMHISLFLVLQLL